MELSFLKMIQNIRNPILDVFFETLTTLGNRGEIWLFMILLLFINKKTRKLARYTLFAMLITVGSIELIIKPIVQRPRPFTEVEIIYLLIKEPSGYSFPSGHAASAFVVATMLYLNNVRFKKTIMFTAFLMAFSRLYLFVHYPTDAIAGALLGILIAYAVNKLMINSKNRQRKFINL